jgi:benzoate membrane transport protein
MNKSFFSFQSRGDFVSFNNFSAGIISGFLAITSTSLLILEAAKQGGFTEGETLSWVFSVYFFCGIFSILIPFYFKIPFTGGHSLAGITYIISVASLFSYNELITGFLTSAILVFLLGISGWFNRIIELLPKEIISSMLAGMILHTLLSLTTQFWNHLFIVLSAILGYFLTSTFIKRIPGLFGALLFSFVIVIISDSLPTINKMENLSYFTVYQPDFSLSSIFVVGIPLCILLLSNDLIVGFNELKKHEYESKTSIVVSLSGMTSMVGAFFGSHCTNLAGIMTSICSSPAVGKKEFRYISSIISGIILVTFAFFASYIIPFILALPKGLPAIITFLTLVGVFISSLKSSLTNKSIYLATIPTFLIAALNFKLFIFNGPILSLMVGLGIYSIMKARNKGISKRNIDLEA